MSITIRDYHNVVYGGRQGFDKALKVYKKFGRKQLLKKFPKKNWSETELRKLSNKIDDTGDTKKKTRQRKTMNISLHVKISSSVQCL